MKIKKILISQPRPEIERSPYFEIARNFNVEVDFRPFIQIEGVPAKEFRKQRIDVLSYNAVIMTSKNAVDNYFRICNEMRIIVPETMKYFCISEATAYYLQKYIQFRKRKIFFSNFSFADLVEIIKKKHKEEKFLLPCTDVPNDEYTDLLDREGIRYVKAPLYKAVYSNLTDINMSQYDMLVLFSSAGITSLLNNFPDFKQHHTLIAAFGEQTAKAVIHAGLKLHIHAPQPQAPSMAMALEQFLKGEQKGSKQWEPVSLSIQNIEEMTPEKKMPPRRNVRSVAKPKEAPVVVIEKKIVVTAKPVAKKTKPAPKKVTKPAAKKASKPKPVTKKSKPAPKKKVVKQVKAKKGKKPVAKKAKAPAKKKAKPAKRKR
ncbi:MAG TPA: uroporphyrinogen-III synthase [Bacteroidia bacterium]|nr:uroporphyrinogen-III synthase [Bacteroidia bacterium]